MLPHRALTLPHVPYKPPAPLQPHPQGDVPPPPLRVPSLSRLAADSGVSHSAISRLVRNESEPTFRTMVLVTAALERRLGKRIDPRDLLTYSFGYPTATSCELTGCRGCAYSHRRRVTEKA